MTRCDGCGKNMLYSEGVSIVHEDMEFVFCYECNQDLGYNDHDSQDDVFPMGPEQDH